MTATSETSETIYKDTTAEASEVVAQQAGTEDVGVESILKFFNVTSHKAFSTFLPIPGVVPTNVVMVSITEVANGVVPFLGLAACQVHNVVAENGGVRVRGFIEWEQNIVVRLSVFVA